VTEAPAQVIAEIEAALRAEGLVSCRLLPVSRYQGSKRGRHAFLAEAADERRVKVRHLVEEPVAAELERLRRGLEPAFAPVLARHGAVLVEPWVDGRPFDEDDAETRTAEAGGLLGRLHGRALEAEEVPIEQSTSRYLEQAEADLRPLLASGELSGRAGDLLRGRLLRLDPGRFRPALVHRDFCAENFVIDTDGRLAVIDNEWFEVGAAGFDVGRTFHRWPMPEAAWAAFLAAYRAGGGDPEPLEFWAIAATLFGARVFLQVSPERLPPLLALLRGLVEG
jgi:hypothetical protein